MILLSNGGTSVQRAEAPSDTILVGTVDGVGGITSGADAAGKIAAGAKLVQFYSGMVFRGPELVQECVATLLRLREGVK